MADHKLKKTAEKSKRFPFIAEHRGGPLQLENHRMLSKWSRECAEHVLYLIDGEVDERLHYALDVAGKWEQGKLQTGMAMKASLMAHEVARQSKSLLFEAIARAVGQAVATAHMADHSLGGAFYALKAVKLAGLNVDKEREWQVKRLHVMPADIVHIVQRMWETKELERRI
jgi:hypothetical protein